MPSDFSPFANLQTSACNSAQVMRFTSSSGSPCQIMATLSRVLVFRCRSRQFTLKFSSPSSNQVCWIFRASVSQIYFRATVGFLNQSKVFACSIQNFSGSRMERSYSASNCAALRCARLMTSGEGGNVRLSWDNDSVEMVLFCVVMVFGLHDISAELFAAVNHGKCLSADYADGRGLFQCNPLSAANGERVRVRCRIIQPRTTPTTRTNFPNHFAASSLSSFHG